MVTLFCLLLAVGPPSRSAEPERPDVFRLHLFAEPVNLDPVVNRAASSNYIFHALYRGLMSYRGDVGLRPAGASVCRRRAPGRLVCDLDARHRWSNGARVTARDYVRSFRRVIDPATASPHADLLFALEQARAVHDGRANPEKLGVTAVGPHSLEFRLSEPDAEFEYKLIHPALAPEPPGGYPPRARAADLVTSGPYRVRAWKTESRAQLVANPSLPEAHRRPDVEFLFIDEDATALALFESGRLSFLRRLIASEIPRFKKDPRLRQIPQARFDYIGLGPSIAPDLRKALVHAVDYPGFLKLFDTRTPPGCISLPRALVDPVPCLRFDQKSVDSWRDSTPKSSPRLDFYFSQMGGDDIRRAAEWFAGQWTTQLGLKLNLHSEEQGAYLSRLRHRLPDIFRKGVSLDRPTCLAGLEMFARGHRENFLDLDDPKLNALIERARRTRGNDERRALCRSGVEILMASDRLIPLGEMYFTILASPKFSGWDLSEINQLDLSRLTLVGSPGS